MQKLCVFDGQIGAPFVDVHLRGVLPGATVAVSRLSNHPLASHFQAPCPVFYLDTYAQKLSFRALVKLGRSRDEMLHRAVIAFLKRHQVTAVVGEFLDQFAEFAALVTRLNIPYVVQGHGIDVSASLRNPEAQKQYQVYLSAKAILTRSEFHRQRLIGIGLPESKIHVNPGGVSIPDSIAQRPLSARKRLLAIGRMCPQKAPILLLESFRKALKRDPDLTLDYVGWGPLSSTVKQFVIARKLDDKIRLHGLVSEDTKQELLNTCGVFVQHSAVDPETGNEEGLPASIQEAMAHGLAVVSTRHTGIAEAVVEGETGLLVDEGDIDAMADAFINVQSQAEDFGARGRQRAKALYAREAECERLRKWLFQ